MSTAERCTADAAWGEMADRLILEMEACHA